MRINNFGAGLYQKLFVHANDIVYTKGGVLGSTLVPAFPFWGTNIRRVSKYAQFCKINALILNQIHCANKRIKHRLLACMLNYSIYGYHLLLVILRLQIAEFFFDSVARVQDGKFIRLVSRTWRRWPLGESLQDAMKDNNARTKSRWFGATLQLLTWTGAWNIFEKSTRLSILGDVAPTNASSYRMGCTIKDNEKIQSWTNFTLNL